MIRVTALCAAQLLALCSSAASATPGNTARCADLVSDAVGDSGATPVHAAFPGDPDGFGDLVSASTRTTSNAVEFTVRLADVPPGGSVYDHMWTVSFETREQRWAAVLEHAHTRALQTIVTLRLAGPGVGDASGPGAAAYQTVGTGTGVVDPVGDVVRMAFPPTLFGRYGLGSTVNNVIAIASVAQPGSAMASAVWTDVDDAKDLTGHRLTGC